MSDPAPHMNIVEQLLADLRPYEGNAKLHPPEQVRAIAKSITEFGFLTPIIVDGRGGIIAGHGRVQAAYELGRTTVPTISVDHLTPEQVRAYRLADNRLAEMGAWDTGLLQAELQALSMDDFNVADIGFDSDAITALIPADSGRQGPSLAPNTSLIESFLEPPMSALITTSGRWQGRKKEWLEALPIDYAQDLGREGKLVFSDDSRRDPQFYQKKEELEKILGRALTTTEFKANITAMGPPAYRLAPVCSTPCSRS